MFVGQTPQPSASWTFDESGLDSRLATASGQFLGPTQLLLPGLKWPVREVESPLLLRLRIGGATPFLQHTP
jgi:hypothetical protein